jgi:hypothetical protein
MIYVYPIGGLGNMFFHIASIWTLAMDNNDELCLLNIEQKIKELDAATNITTTWRNTTHAEKYKYFFNRISWANGNASKVITLPFQYIPIKYVEGAEYRGYFQSEKYFKHRRDEILNLFRPHSSFQNEIDKYSNLFGNISLHVRRSWIGLNISHILTVQSMDYYNKAISMLPKDLKILVFSDDLEWCKQNFIGERFVFIDEIDYIALYLMGKMKHNINSSSTFSWWGAWMGNPETVIAPKQWFGINSGIPFADVVPENWIKL